MEECVYCEKLITIEDAEEYDGCCSSYCQASAELDGEVVEY